MASYICDKEGHITHFNAAAVELWGRQPDATKDRWCGAEKIFLHGQQLKAEQYPASLVLSDKPTPPGTEIVIGRPDGTFRTVLVFAYPVLDANNQLIGAHNTLVDITEQRQDQRKYAALSAIVESSNDAIISKSLEGIIMSWNGGAQRIFGYDEEEIVGKSINKLIPKALRNEEETIIKNIKAGNTIDHYQTVRLAKSGKEIPISLTISPVRDKSGEIIGASKIARDISEQLQRDQTIRYNTQKLEILHFIGKTVSEKLEVASIMEKVIDASTSITGADRGVFYYQTLDEQGKRLVHYALSGEIQQDDEYMIKLSDGQFFDALFSIKDILRIDDLSDEPVNAPHDYLKLRGSPWQIRSCLAIPIWNSRHGHVGGMLLGHTQVGVFEAEDEDMMRSIASQVEAALDNSKLFEEIKALNTKKDEFIALASHELKTPLTTVKGYLQILERYAVEEGGRRFLTKALRQMDKINALISELLDISRIEAGKLQLHFEQFDIKGLIIDIIETFHFSTNVHDIILRPVESTIVVEADRQRIEQVIINLLTNAIKYSPDFNQVYVSLSQSNDEVIVEIEDKGIGLSQVQQENIFTRFYRAEESSKMPGIGLGLYLSKDIITRHGGRIGVRSELGKGSTFFFFLPLKNQQADFGLFSN